MSGPAGLARKLSPVLIALTTGCAMHTPERSAARFLHELRNGAAQSEGRAAFQQVRARLHLKERTPASTSQVYRKSAIWSRRREEVGLESSNVLQDPPDRFDLTLSWFPPRPLEAGLLEKLLGAPYGTSATGDNGWLIAGGIVEYRAAQTEVPYLLFSSAGYIRDPLDFLEAADLPHFPSLASVTQYLDRNARERSPESRAYQLPGGASVAVYYGIGPRKAPYLAGVMISLPGRQGIPVNPAEFISVLLDLGIPTPDRLIDAVSGANQPGTDVFAVYCNFALALSRPRPGDPSSSLTVWRRIESPRALCEHLRPDLARCSTRPQ